MYIGKQNVLLSSASSTGVGLWLNVSDVDFVNFAVINSTSANNSIRFIGVAGDPADEPTTSYVSGSVGTTSLPVYALAYMNLAASMTSSIPATTTIDTSGTVATTMYRVITKGLTHITAQVTAGTSTGTSGTPMTQIVGSMYRDN